MNSKFKILHSPTGRMMTGKATIEEMSEKSGMDTEAFIGKIQELIGTHR